MLCTQRHVNNFEYSSHYHTMKDH